MIEWWEHYSATVHGSRLDSEGPDLNLRAVLRQSLPCFHMKNKNCIARVLFASSHTLASEANDSDNPSAQKEVHKGIPTVHIKVVQNTAVPL